MQRYVAAFGVAMIAFALTPSAEPSAQAPARGTPPPAVRPGLLFREEWKKPYTGTPTPQNIDEIRRVNQQAVSNADLELHLYGADVQNVLVTEHEGREDLWNGLARSPVAVTLRDKTRWFDLTGLSRLRWMVRTEALHIVYPVVKFRNGTLAAGNKGITTDGEFIQTEVVFSTMRWYKLDAATVTTTAEVKDADLRAVDEVGYADLMVGGGRGLAGWCNVSAIELYANSTPR